MPIQFACESCGRPYQVSDALGGRTGKCKTCGHAMKIPTATEPAAASGEAEELALAPVPVPVPPPQRAQSARPGRPVPVAATAESGDQDEEDEASGLGTRTWVLAGAGALLGIGLLAWFLRPGPGAVETGRPASRVQAPPSMPRGLETTAAATAPARASGTPLAQPAGGIPAVSPATATPPPAPPTPAPVPAPVDRDQLLARAAEARRALDADTNGDNAGALQPAFNEALRAAHEVLVEVPVGTPEQPVRDVTRIVLNSRRLGFDGIRFRAPADGSRLDLQWEFIMPAVANERGRAMTAWYIMPLSGEMIGFTGYGMGPDRPVPGVDLPETYHVVQWLGQAQIRPGQEYLIWFSFEANSPPVPTYVKLNLIPPQPDVRERLAISEAALKQSLNLPEPASGLGVSADGTQALVAAGATLYRGDLHSGQLARLWDGPAGQVRCAAFAPDGKVAAVGLADGAIVLVDLEAGQELRRCTGHSGGLRCLAFLPDGTQLVSGAEDRTARLWDVATGQERRQFADHSDQVLCLAVAPDGKRLVTGPSIDDKVARVWDLDSGALVAKLEGNTEAVYALAFTPDSQCVLTGGEDRSLRLYEAATGRPIRRFKPDNGGTPHALAFLPDGRVVVGAEGAYLNFWSARAGRFLGAYEGDFPGVQLVATAPDGRLLTAGNDGTLQVWDAPSAEAMPDLTPPTVADLNYLRKVAVDLEAQTPDELAELTSLQLSGKVDDAGLAHLARLVDLRSLSLPGATRVKGPGLTHLKSLKHLHRLDLTGTAIDDTDLKHLEPLPWLEDLRLGQTRVTSAGVARLKSLTNLKTIGLEQDAVSNDALLPLSELLYLERLILVGTRVDDRGLELLPRFPRLKSVELQGSQVTEAGVAALKQAMPDLQLDD